MYENQLEDYIMNNEIILKKFTDSFTSELMK